MMMHSKQHNSLILIFYIIMYISSEILWCIKVAKYISWAEFNIARFDAVYCFVFPYCLIILLCLLKLVLVYLFRYGYYSNFTWFSYFWLGRTTKYFCNKDYLNPDYKNIYKWVERKCNFGGEWDRGDTLTCKRICPRLGKWRLMKAT